MPAQFSCMVVSAAGDYVLWLTDYCDDDYENDYKNVLFHNKQFKSGHVFRALTRETNFWSADPVPFLIWSVIWVSLKIQWWRPQSSLGSATVHVPNVYSYFFNCFIIYNVDDKVCVMCPKLILNINYLFRWNLSTRTTGQCHTLFSRNLTYQKVPVVYKCWTQPISTSCPSLNYLHAFQPTISFTTPITFLQLTVMFV